MSTEQAKVEFKVVTEGLAEAQAGAQKLHDLMEATSKMAASIRIPSVVQAAQEQVAATNQPVAARARPRATMAAYMDPAGGNDTENYRKARGFGGTGAEGRDFAKQASGLGGLVHVYATFAANLFAVSAAFSALSKAADTTNMVKGLDQLGAASGRGLGTLSKAMVEATGGALSLKEAMTSTALASSAGMTNTAILRMTEVAKKASLALGRDMSDSMDRLTKGIVKVQPELLDELGIMTRVIPAQEKYAREVGKSVDALTDFEKKQAFANAVLEEGEKKFSSIKIDTNAYTQLSASLANVAQSGLEIVNKVLTPIAETLAKSPTGLALALSGIGIVLLKQAIPALGQFRQGLQQAQDMALQKVEKRSELVGESGTYDAKIADRAKRQFLLESDYANKSFAEKKELIKKANDIADEAARKSEERSKGLFGHESATNRIRDRMYQDAAVASSKNYVNQVQNAYGMRAAFSELNAQVDSLRKGSAQIKVGDKLIEGIPKINMFSGAMIKLTGTIGILGSAAFTLMEAFAPWIMAITVIGTALAYFIDVNRKATKQVEEAQKAFEGVQAAGKTLANTLDLINSKPFLDQISNASVQARAAAMNELSDQFTQFGKKADEARKKSTGFFDRLADARLGNIAIKTMGFNPLVALARGPLPATEVSQQAKNIADATQTALVQAAAAVEGGEGEKSYKESLKKILGVNYTDASDLERQLGRIPDELYNKQPKLQKALQDTSRIMNIAASYGKELEDAWTAASKSFDNIMTSFTLTDPLGKLGDETIKVGIAMTKAIDSFDNRLAELSTTATSTNRLRFFTPGLQQEFIDYGKKLEESKKKIDALKEQRSTLSDTADEAKQTLGSFWTLPGTKDAAQKTLDAANLQIKAIDKQVQVEKQKLDDQTLYLKAQDETFAFGSKMVEDSIGQGFKKAGIGLEQSFLSIAGNTKEGILRQVELEKQMIDVEIANIDAMLSLVIATNALTRVQEENAIYQKKTDIERGKADKTITESEATKQLGQVMIREVALKKANELSERRVPIGEAVKVLNNTSPNIDDVTSRRAMQMQYPTIVATAQAEAQKQLKTNQKITAELNGHTRIIGLEIEQQIKINELLSKTLALRVAELDYIAQSSVFVSEDAVIAKNKLEEGQAILAQQKEQLAIEGQIRDVKYRLSRADVKGAPELRLSLGRLELDLANKKAMMDDDAQIRAMKYVQQQKAARIAEFNYARDYQLLNNTINNDSINSIQNMTGLYLDFVQQQKTDIEISNLKLNNEKAINANLEDQAILRDKIKQYEGSTDEKSIETRNIATRQLAEQEAKAAQLNMKYQNDKLGATAKNIKLALEGQESIRKKTADIAFLEIETANKVAMAKLDIEEKILQQKVSMGQMVESQAADEIAKMAEKKLQLDLATQAADITRQEEELKAQKVVREKTYNAMLSQINQDFLNKKIQQEKEAQDQIDALKKNPNNLPTEEVDKQVKALEGTKAGIPGALAKEQTSAQEELRARIDLQNKGDQAALDSKVAVNKATAEGRKKEIELIKEAAIYQAKLNQLTKDQAFYTGMAESAAKSFAAVMGEAGNSLASVVKLVAQNATAEEKYALERQNAEKAVQNAKKGTADQQKQAQVNLERLEAQYYANKIDNIADVAHAAAGMFDKDSKQYEALMKLEKVIHLAKMAYMVIEQTIWLKNWAMRMLDIGQEGAASTASKGASQGMGIMDKLGKLFGGDSAGIGSKALDGVATQAGSAADAAKVMGDYGLSSGAASGAGAAAGAAGAAEGAGAAAATAGAAEGGIAAAGAAMGPVGWIALAALAAFSLFSSSSKPKGPTPEQMASVSGTGLTYNADAQLVATGTGALGDPKAANEAVQKSIDYLAKINYENLQFDKNKALVALEAIRDNTANFVKSIGSVGALGNTTASGVTLGASKGFLGFSSKSTELAASGVAIKGTLGEIADGIGGSIKKFEDIRNSSSSFFGLFSSSKVTRNETDVSQAAQDYMKNVFVSFRNAITSSAATFGQDGGLLKPIIDQLDVSFTAYKTGETSAEFAQRIQEEIGNKLDLAVKAVFPGIDTLADKFQKFGETLAEFAMRVQGDAEQIKFAFQSVGQNYIDNTAGDAAGAMIQRGQEQSLIKAFGSSQDLFQAIDKYGSSMLTDAERLAPVRKNVDEQLLKLFPALSEGGKTTITTREQFDKLVKSLDPLDPATQDLWVSMTKLGPAFASVTEAVNHLTDAELKKAQQDQYSTILNIKASMDANDTISTAKALAITRQRELDSMDALLKPTQLYIYALQDEATAKSKLQTSYDKVKTAINGTIDSLKTQVTTLQDYKKNLQLSDKGNLTPQEAYAASKGQLESTAAMAQQVLGADASKADIAARDKAVSALPSLIDQFLAQSKTSYASSDQYQADYSWVNSLLDTTTTSLTSQQTDAEKQLTALNDSVSYLTTIDESTKTTANLMADFTKDQKAYQDASMAAASAFTVTLGSILDGLSTAVSPIQAHAQGGMAVPGLGLVGEQGPELVDFATPARVYNASQTAAFGDNTALVAELKALRDELTQLRNDQKEQTGHIIQSNYDANNRNAQALSSVTENAIKQQTWKERSQVVVA